jgi:hypothetical protein
MTTDDILEHAQRRAAALDAALCGFPSAESLLDHLVVICKFLPSQKSLDGVAPYFAVAIGNQHLGYQYAQLQHSLNRSALMQVLR